jgi:chitinase
MYQKVVSLKNKNPKLKVLLAVGGWNQGSLAFSDMTRNNTKRTSFINGTISFLLDHKFDGLGK